MWTRQSADQWGQSVEYADGVRHDWAIRLVGEGFVVEVRRPEGILRAHKTFYRLDEARNFAQRFIERPDGQTMFNENRFRPIAEA